MNGRISVKSMLFALALSVSLSAQAQVMSGPSILGAGTPGASPPPLTGVTQGAPIANTPSLLNPPPSTSTLQDANVQGQYQPVPGGVTTQGRVGVDPGCPCTMTTPNTRAPVGGCNC